MKKFLIGLVLCATSLTFAEVKQVPPTAGDLRVQALALLECDDEASLQIEKIEHYYRYNYDSKKEPLRRKVFYIASCPIGAYNFSSALYAWTEWQDLRVIPFAVPRTNEKLELVGMGAETIVGALAYDKNKGIFTTFAKGRGLGDTHVYGVYSIINGDVVLTEYAQDNTENGKVDPKVVFKASARR